MSDEHYAEKAFEYIQLYQYLWSWIREFLYDNDELRYTLDNWFHQRVDRLYKIHLYYHIDPSGYAFPETDI